MIEQSNDEMNANVFTSSRCRDLVKQQTHYSIVLSKKKYIHHFCAIFAKESAYMESVSIASVQLTDVQIFYKRNRIVISFKSNAQSNPAFREHLRPLNSRPPQPVLRLCAHGADCRKKFLRFFKKVLTNPFSCAILNELGQRQLAAAWLEWRFRRPPRSTRTNDLSHSYVFCVPSLCLCTGRVLYFYRR